MATGRPFIAPLLLTSLLASAAAHGQACGTWEPLGIPDPQPGIDGPTGSIAVFDDGSGPAVYVSGGWRLLTPSGFAPAGLLRWGAGGTGAGVWDPVAWVGTSLTVFDDGNGSALYGCSATGVRRLEGANAVLVGDVSNVLALAVHTEAGASHLYAGGTFTTNGSVELNGVARWNGHIWEPVGGGVAGGPARVAAMLSHDDGSGPALYIGGDFITAGGPGGLTANGLARWRSGAWETASQGLSAPLFNRPVIRALGVGPDGALHAGGAFNVGTGSRNVARWDGTVWSAMGGGFTANVLAFVTFDGQLHAGTGTFGGFCEVASWNGTDWQTAARIGPSGRTIAAPQVLALGTFDDGGGETLYIGGDFGSVDGVIVNNIARVRAGIAEAPDGSSAVIRDVRVLDAGDGPSLYITGHFHRVHGQIVNSIARYRAGEWEPVGGGIGGLVYALAAGQVAGTMERVLIAAGTFERAGQTPVQNIAQWSDSGGWIGLGDGLPLWASQVLPAGVRSLVFHDEGAGLHLYAGGFFAGGPGEPRYLARWVGIGWTSVGNAGDPFPFVVSGLASMNGDLYIGGSFTTVGGVQARNIARWNGSSWSPLGTGASSMVNELLTHDIGSGSLLFMRGSFEEVGGVVSRRVAAWDGASWLSLDGGVNWPAFPTGLTARGGEAPAVYMFGRNAVPGGFSVGGWDGQTWTGIPGQPTMDESFNWLRGAWFDDGDGEQLYVGGGIMAINGMPSIGMARWTPCAPCYANCDSSTVPPILNVDDFTCFINEFASAQSLPHAQQLTHYANCDASTIAPVLNVDDFTCFINAFAAGCP